MKKIIFFIFLSIFMIGNVNALKITSLGDSIPNGVLLNDKEKSYDNMIAKKLGFEFYEYSVSGYTTEQLLSSLDKEEVKENISNSDIIFINIGSGDLLDLTDDIDFSSFGFNSEEKMNLKDSTDDFKNFLVEAFKSKMGDKTNEVINNFSLKFKSIIEKIKSYNPDAKIYVNNAYNPFFDLSIPFILDLSEIENIVEEAIKAFNETLKTNDDYTVIDIYSILRDNNYLNVDPLNNSFDPHPSEKGHQKIYEAYLKELCYKITYDGNDYYILKGDKFEIEPKQKEGYTFDRWNYDLDKIDKDITLEEIYKSKTNYLLFIIPSGVLLLLIIIVLIIKKKSKK